VHFCWRWPRVIPACPFQTKRYPWCGECSSQTWRCLQ
jgi:hypothetical protein